MPAFQAMPIQSGRIFSQRWRDRRPAAPSAETSPVIDVVAVEGGEEI
jgi:hypothetical protein